MGWDAVQGSTPRAFTEFAHCGRPAVVLKTMSHYFQATKSAITLMLLLLVFAPLRGMGQPTRVFFGDPAHPVSSGEAWLIANRWGAYQGVLVATVREGKLEARGAVQFPQYWEQAFDYKLLLAVSDQSLEPPKSPETDDAYGWFDRRPEYLKHFSTIYLSPPLPPDNRGEDWETALGEIGKLTGDRLVLPPPTPRTIRLLYPDGKPLAGARVLLSLFGSGRNHCGVAVGITLGAVTTNGDGEIIVVAPHSAIALTIQYLEEEAGGPTGTAFAFSHHLIIGGEQKTTLKRLWTLPKRKYVLRLHTAKDQPVANAHLTGCDFDAGCQGGCGPLPLPESDASGVFGFRYQDLRSLRSLTVVDKDGKERNLTDSEMRELLTTYRLNLRWD